MAERYPRDLIGYGANPPDPRWPNGARLALNFVMNYEEGSEPSVPDGEPASEVGLTELPLRDLALASPHVAVRSVLVRS